MWGLGVVGRDYFAKIAPSFSIVIRVNAPDLTACIILATEYQDNAPDRCSYSDHVATVITCSGIDIGGGSPGCAVIGTCPLADFSTIYYTDGRSRPIKANQAAVSQSNDG